MKQFKMAMNQAAYDRFIQTLNFNEYEALCEGIGNAKKVTAEAEPINPDWDVQGWVVTITTSGAGEYDTEFKNAVYHKVRSVLKKAPGAKFGGNYDALL